jgi:hypothetical protein
MQFAIWNGITISVIAAEAFGNTLIAPFPYRVPDATCITWCDAASGLATTIAAMPF